jgi:hypothetical protein
MDSRRGARRFGKGKYEEILTTGVAGVTHEGRFIRCGKAFSQWEISGKKGGDKRLRFVRDKKNKFDKNAISVEWNGIGQLGFIPAKIAAVLSPLIDAGLEVKPTVRHFGDFVRNEEDGDLIITFMKVGIAVRSEEAIKVRKRIIKEIGRSGQRWRILE